ncbi:class I adenylate-forming enzyme family protein [Paenibacillus validus]|uniref:class I adenylate-forming enzyme family protein n=1 Tax=Paenibacillus validus TaxID=44253 RepID=UPI000FDB4935|nr:class I adenylate-forming enzyme family protein [Paenibacillus validus]MED4601206.1 class I adenylate-forming enzyme family protein [Paenibacillus validus]MED4606911.1 class I adenylate-forming enzyme family protein [Paenibacillus validus]
MQGNSVSVSQLLDMAVQGSPDKEAIYDLTRRLTYGELQEEVNRLASALVSLGIKEGDRVGVSLPNWHETVQLFFAIAKIGAILVPFNPKYRLHELQHILGNSGAKVVFVSQEFEKTGFESGEPNHLQLITVRYEKEGCLSFTDLLAGSNDVIPPQPAIDPLHDTFCILYTSGTTGVPKGAMVTHRSVVQSGMTIAKSLQCVSDDVFIILAPIFHIFGMAVNLMSAVYCQSKMVLLEKYKPKDALKLIEQEKVTIHHAVPSMLNLELKDPDFDSYDLSTLRAGITGAATCPPETIKGVREKMGMNLCISYGITETGTVTITQYDDKESNILETVGKAVEGVEVKIVNDRRETLPPGETGEIACRGFGVMKEYYQSPEQTRQVLDPEGWYYTGDLGTMDEDGYIRFVGRKKELIIRGGYNIYPQEIEGLLQNHPKVLESAIVGLPDATLGEIVCAAVKLKPNVQATQEEIIDYLKTYIASYKLPGKVVFVEELPTTASGKIQKVKLKDELMNRLEAG